MPIKDNFPENGNHDGDAARRGRKDQFAQTESMNTKTRYTAQANIDDILVRGMVVDENNLALNNVKVEFWDRIRGKLLYATSTIDNGEWFLRLPADQYYVAFFKDDLYDEIGYETVIQPVDRVQEFGTVRMDFNPPEFRITPVEKYYLRCERAFLGDTDPNIYQLDNEHKFIYSDESLVIYSQMTLNDVNAAPAKSGFLLHELPLQWRSLIVWGSVAQAIIARGMIENQNQFQYADGGLSLTIQRAAHYLSTATMIQDRYEKARDKIKLSYRPGPHVLSRSVVFKVRTLAARQWRLR